MADVVIAGGGPAGATLALLLGRAGLSVELYEAKQFPREKPCGEGIMPAGVAVLERLGLRAAVGGRPLASVRYHGFGMTAESGFAPRADGTVPAVLGQRRLAAGSDVAGRGARDAGRARVRGGAGRGRRDRRRPRGRPARRRRAAAGRPDRRRGRPGFARAPLARARSPRARGSARRRAHALPTGAPAAASLAARDLRGPRLRALRGAAARRRAAAGRRSPIATRSAPARASRSSAGSASSRCCATGWTARRR